MNRNKLSPFIHGNDSVTMIHFDLFAALLPLIIISVVQNGLRVLVMCFLSAISSYVVELLGNLIKGNFKPFQMRVCILSICITLLCPITVPIWMPAAGSVFATLLVRVILSDNYKKLFMTPAIGWLFLLSIWPKEMMTYPLYNSNENFPIFANIENFDVGITISHYLQFSQKPPYRMLDILAGLYSGGMGTTCVAAILLIAIYFIVRRSIAWQVPLSMICTVSVFALFINRAGVSPLYSIIYELASSSFIFVAIFIAGDLINAPKLPLSRVLFGITLGVVMMFLRYFGLYEHSIAFALVIVNLFADLLDMLTIKLRIKKVQNY